MKSNSFPLKVFLEKNTKYTWCTCGRSERLPFCDGSHKGSGMEPIIFEVDTSDHYYLCKCGNSRNKPYCDNTHKRFRS